MPLVEQDYCLEQINVPPKLPMILKQFCKCAIRTQPYDLLKWSSAYFHALARGEEPPTKHRLEYPPESSAHGLTPGYLKVLLRQLGVDYNKVVSVEAILKHWDQLCLDTRDSDMIIRIGRFRDHCKIKHFLSIAAGLLTCTITDTMIQVCKLFTFEPDGGSAMIPIKLFMELYGYLGSLRCDGAKKDSSVICLCAVHKSSSSLDMSEDKPEPEPEKHAEPKLAFDLSESKPSHEGHEVGIGDVSMTSQDTDIDFEFESYAKEDERSRITLQSFGEEMGESFLHEGEASYQTSEPTLESIKTKSLEIVEKHEEKKEESGGSSEGEMSKQIPEGESMTDVSKQSGAELTVESSQNVCDMEDSFPNYPCVPGIGRQLLDEEIATVAIWMVDCARRQEGLVGPRNIRHINCPPLTGFCHASLSVSSSCTDT